MLVAIGEASFEVTLDAPSLFVAALLYDDSGATPSLINGPTAMLNFDGNSYRSKFRFSDEKAYLLKKVVYTDGTFTVRDTNYAESSEILQVVDLAALVFDASVGRVIGNVI